jgi:4-hydroxybenzoyl-CoA thioesterase
MAFVYEHEIKFRHCDPAGIVFYPRFFEMMNDTVEAFFKDVLRFPFAEMHKKFGVPTAQISAEFHAPCRLGDTIDITLTCARLGRSSLDVTLVATDDGNARFTGKATLVFIDSFGASQAWGGRVRALLEQELEGET